MNLVYAQEPSDLSGMSIFLAGPTPRSQDVKSWRTDAVSMLKELGFTGTLFLPEMRDNGDNNNYDFELQREWEEKNLNRCDVIVFWIPRDLKTMPAFTTNIEWGFWTAKKPEKLVLGIPESAPMSDYIIYFANRFNIPFSTDLKQTLINAISKDL